MATLSHGELETLWELAGGDPAKADLAAAIAQAESGGCQYAKAGPNDDRPVKQCTYRQTSLENSYGLWQINRRAHPQYGAAELYTPLGNARAAVAIASRGASFTAWSTFTNGAYRAYLQVPTEPAPQPGSTFDPPASAVAPGGHRGYADLRNSLGRHLPTSLDQSRRSGLTVLNALAHARKVKR